MTRMCTFLSFSNKTASSPLFSRSVRRDVKENGGAYSTGKKKKIRGTVYNLNMMWFNFQREKTCSSRNVYVYQQCGCNLLVVSIPYFMFSRTTVPLSHNDHWKWIKIWNFQKWRFGELVISVHACFWPRTGELALSARLLENLSVVGSRSEVKWRVFYSNMAARYAAR